jgi:acyl-coenzyme A thioesterase PaaI-like protein
MKIPQGYKPFIEDTGYIGHNGPYYVRLEEGKTRTFGFATDERHGNPNNVIHGAALVGFVDTLLGHLIVNETGRYCATISLTTEFISGAAIGSWVEASARIKRTTNSLAFVGADVYFEENILLTASGVFKLFKPS